MTIWYLTFLVVKSWLNFKKKSYFGKIAIFHQEYQLKPKSNFNTLFDLHRVFFSSYISIEGRTPSYFVNFFLSRLDLNKGRTLIFKDIPKVRLLLSLNFKRISKILIILPLTFKVFWRKSFQNLRFFKGSVIWDL